MPLAFKLDHLQSFKPILFQKFSNFSTFILGGQFLLPQRADNGKREILPTPRVDETEAPNSNPGIVTSLPSFFWAASHFLKANELLVVVGLAFRRRARATLMANVEARWLEERAFLSRSSLGDH